MLSNAYFLAKFRFDTAENEPAKNLQNFANKLQSVKVVNSERSELSVPLAVETPAGDMLIESCSSVVFAARNSQRNFV